MYLMVCVLVHHALKDFLFLGVVCFDEPDFRTFYGDLCCFFLFVCFFISIFLMQMLTILFPNIFVALQEKRTDSVSRVTEEIFFYKPFIIHCTMKHFEWVCQSIMNEWCTLFCMGYTVFPLLLLCICGCRIYLP